MTDLAALLDNWIAALNERSEARRALVEAHKNSPLGVALAAAEKKEKSAKEAYSRAFYKQHNESLNYENHTPGI